MTHITEHFTRIALTQESLDLTLIHNDRQVYHLLAGQGVRDRIGLLFGKAIAEDLLETTRQERGMQSKGVSGATDRRPFQRKISVCLSESPFYP